MVDLTQEVRNSTSRLGQYGNICRLLPTLSRIILRLALELAYRSSRSIGEAVVLETLPAGFCLQ